MATAVGHLIARFVVSGFAKTPKYYAGSRIGLTTICAVVASLPVIDDIPGIIVRTPAKYHQRITRNLGLAFAVNGIIAAFYSMGGKSFSVIFMVCPMAYSYHLAIDILGPDRRYPVGITIFCPVIDAAFISPMPILMGVHYASSLSTPTLNFSHLVRDGHLKDEPIRRLPGERLGRKVDHGNRLRLICNSEIWYRMAIESSPKEEIKKYLEAV